jgi:hypothetical protein
MSFEIQKYLMSQAGYGITSDEERSLITTFCEGYYRQISSCVIEVEGSPVRGRALVYGSDNFSEIRGREWHVVIQLRQHRYKTLSWYGYDGPQTSHAGIAEKIVRFAFSILDLQGGSK